MSYVSAGGQDVTKARLQIPAKGVWFIDLELSEDTAITGEIVIGEVELFGAVIREGVSNGHRTARVVGGAGGWGQLIQGLGYANDANVKALAVIQDAANAAGESLAANQAAPNDRIGVKYVRETGPASSVLDAVGGAWYVDLDGLTYLNARPSPVLDLNKVTVLNYQPGTQWLDLVAPEITDVPVGGTVVVDDQDLVISSLTVDIDEKGVNIRAWVSENVQPADRMSLLIGAIAGKSKTELFGLYQYRVVGMAANRVNIQPVDDSSGLPSVSAVSMWSAPGISAELTPGSECAIQFLNGDRTKPVIMAFAPPDSPTHEPVKLNLGGEDGAPIARVGDVVNVLFPPSIPFSGTLAGSPIVGVMTPFTAATAVIQGGSSQVFSK